MRAHLAIFFRRSRRCGSFESLCDKIAQPDGLTLPAIRSNDRRKSRERRVGLPEYSIKCQTVEMIPFTNNKAKGLFFFSNT